LISDKYKCVFIHIPKTAGQSIETFFLSLHGLAWKQRGPLLLRHNPDPMLGPEHLAHLKASEYTDFGYLTPDTFNSYFKFSFIRNPWRRLVSEFNYRKYGMKYSFKEFVFSGLPEKDSYSDAYRHIVPQYDFLHDAAGQLIVDYVGRFETLQSDFDNVCSKLGISDSRLPHVNPSGLKRWINIMLKHFFSKNTSTTRHYASYYDSETLEFVEKMYCVDISGFGYKFGD